MPQDRIRQEDTIEVNLLDLFWSVLRYWRSILLAMIILGILLAGYGIVREYRRLTDEAFVKEQQEAYASDLETYELKKKQLEKKLENLEEDLVRQEFYEKNSVMLLFDQYNVYVQTASYYINTGYEIAPELYYQNPNYTGVITNSYKAAIDRIDLDAIIASPEHPELTARNPLGGAKKMLYTSVDAGNGILNITIYGDTFERTEKIYDEVKKIITEQQILLNRVIGDHTVGILSEKNYVDIDTDFGALQRSFDDKSESITAGIEDTKEELENLEEPVNETPTKASVIKTGIKFGIVGVLGGFILLGGLCLVKLLLEDRVNSADSIRCRYGMPVLGEYLTDVKKQTLIDKIFSSKLGMPVSKTKEEQIQFIISNIQLYLKDTPEILLVGNCSTEKLNALKEKLSSLVEKAQIKVGGNINTDSAAVDALSGKTTVICVETWTKTPHKAVRRELRTIEDSGNENLGFILVN